MSHTVVITGATGFVGSHVLQAFIDIDHKNLHIIAACRDRTKLIKDFNGEVREGDLRNPDYLDRVLSGADIVCHCAAWTSLWGKKKESRELYLKPTLNLIDKALEWHVKRFISISTTSAASPGSSYEALSPGIARRYWPHLNHVIEIENYMKDCRLRGVTMVNMRLGLFAGERFALGLLPILLPRLRTRLVPWVSGGKTRLPIISGQDIGQAILRASLAPNISEYEAFNVVGPEIPTAREVITHISKHYGYPKPMYSVPFPFAYTFAWLMEKIDPLVPWEPLITRSIIHLLEETDTDNKKAEEMLGFIPEVHWKEAIRLQIEAMKKNHSGNMKMHRPIKPFSITD